MTNQTPAPEEITINVHVNDITGNLTLKEECGFGESDGAEIRIYTALPKRSPIVKIDKKLYTF